MPGVDTEDGSEQLASALGHLREDRLEPALLDLLAAWRKLRAPEIADLLEVVTTELDRSLPPIDVRARNAQARWLDMAGRRRSADVGRLLAALPHGGMSALRGRYELLGVFAPDPRLLEPAVTIPTRYHSYEAGPLLTMAFDLVAQTNDPRMSMMLDGMLEDFFTPSEGESPAWKKHLAKHERKAAKVRDSIKPVPTTSQAVIAQVKACYAECKRLEARAEVPALADTTEPAKDASTKTSSASATHLDALLAAVLASPDDDEPRIVYSDALQQAGDPRGEFIALQLERARAGKLGAAAEKRERELLKAHVRDWTSPLDVALRPESIRFERGFLSACRVEWSTTTQRDGLRGHPLWSTVRELDCDDMEFATHPVFSRLQRGTLTPAALAVVARRDAPLSLEAVIGTLQMRYGLRLRYGVPVRTAEEWGPALDVGALTSLRSLQLFAEWTPENDMNLAPEHLRWLLDSKLGRQLTELDLYDEDSRLSPWLEELRLRDSELNVRVRFPNANTASGTTAILATFDLVRRGRAFEVDITFNNEMVDLRYLTIREQIERFLVGFPSPHAPRARVRYNGSKKRTTLGFAAIAKILERAFPELSLE